MPEPLMPIQTVSYKTYVKKALVEALRPVFASHPDNILQRVKVGIDFPFEKTDYPSVVIRFYERSIQSAGVGHYEWLEDTTQQGKYIKYKHNLYQGDIEFAIYALSSYDRDIVSDSLVQVLTMGDLESYTNQFLSRIYGVDADIEPTSVDHMINLNTDQISGFGETQTIAPWMPEDTLVYQTSYRINIHGEFYSRTPANVSYGLVEHVETYPYDPIVGETKPNPNPEDPGIWELYDAESP